MATNTQFVYKIAMAAISCAAVLWILWQAKDLGWKSPMDHSPRPHWKEIADNKRNKIMEKIPQEWILPQSILEQGRQRSSLAGDFFEGLLDPETARITGQDSSNILDSVRNRTLTAVQVVRAFSKRTAFAHQLVSRNPPAIIMIPDPEWP